MTSEVRNARGLGRWENPGDRTAAYCDLRRIHVGSSVRQRVGQVHPPPLVKAWRAMIAGMKTVIARDPANGDQEVARVVCDDSEVGRVSGMYQEAYFTVEVVDA